MKEIIFILNLLICLTSKGQTESSRIKSYILKGKLEKNVTFEKDCNNDLSEKNAIIIEVTVTSIEDIEQFGNKLYLIVLCPDMPGEGMFDGEEARIEISEYRKRWPWEVKILNPELLNKNKGQMEYWLNGAYTKLPYYNCSTKK